ncbi:unnamed protein product [Mesocestoides corti]|uniref:ATP-dependent RNA helicase n=1 Tax=Mesocestoides corti TaxID=53468 RepID=A0A3P6HEP5_MESCO|nr:unnamed protein product [Mesocestoides corti]
MPLSEPTLKGLSAGSFTKPTAVQKKSLKYALMGKDIIVEAKTGSGKTLAFVIPILECIYTEKITAFDGPVAVVLTPTRELAKQIFSVFDRVGKFHNFTMLDVMGGKTRTDKRQEWQRAAKANILIGTPGRFAQHQQQNPTLDMSNLRILVLDEVDRLLDPTFRNDLLAITDNLTTDRQCLLFSATLSKTRDQLSCLNLKSPVFISTNTTTLAATPAHLIQFYSVVPLDKKLDYLWTFLQSHCKKKIIVFFSTQKQVRFVHDLFLQMRPYFTVMQLRGNMLQSKRFKIYEKFSQTPRGAVLFATNVAERGLDFPEVDWVVQFDCPKQLDDYIHRVGRTARAEHVGRAITFLLPSEVKLVELLAQRNVILRQQQFPESRIRPVVSTRAPAILASQPELATSARAAFTAYLRDYCHVPKGSTSAQQPVSLKSVFQPSELPIDEFAASLGLPLTPELPKMMLHHQPTRASGEKRPSIWSGEDNAGSDDEENDGLLKRKTFSVLQPELRAKAEASGRKLLELASSEDEEDEESLSEDNGPVLAAKSDSVVENPIMTSAKKTHLTRIQLAKRELKRNIRSHSKIEFDENGKASLLTLCFRYFQLLSTPLLKTVGGVPVPYLDADSELPPARLDIEAERERLRTVVDREDKIRWRERIREKHRLERKKAKEARKLEKDVIAPRLAVSDEEFAGEDNVGGSETGGEGDSGSNADDVEDGGGDDSASDQDGDDSASDEDGAPPDKRQRQQ